MRTNSLQNEFVDRDTGRICSEQPFGDWVVNFFYNEIREQAPLVFNLLASRWFSRFLGWLNYDFPFGRNISGIKRFLNRHTRWGKLRWQIGGVKYFSEILANPVFVAALPVLFKGPSREALSFAAVVGLIKVLGDSVMGRRITSLSGEQGVQTPAPFIYFLAPLKDLIIGIVWFVPLVSSTIVWRGNRYVIGKDSRLSPCSDTGFWSWGFRITESIRARVA